MEMLETFLGDTGIRVSRLCFGTLPMGPSQKGLPLGAGTALLRLARGLGVYFFDAAEGYRTYPYLREAFAKTRRRLVVASKSPAEDYDGMRRSVDKALAGTGRPRIDVFSLHAPRSLDPFGERRGALRALHACKREGLVRAVGLSTHVVSVVREAVARDDVDVIHPLVNQSGLGIIGGNSDDMKGAIEAAALRGKGVYAMKALAGGNLIDQALPALRWVLSLDGVHAVAVGMVAREEVNANAAFFSGAPDPAPLFAAVEKKRKKLVFLPGVCRGCGNCVSACHSEALVIKRQRPVLDEGRCILCGYCASACPQFAIRVA